MDVELFSANSICPKCPGQSLQLFSHVSQISLSFTGPNLKSYKLFLPPNFISVISTTEYLLISSSDKKLNLIYSKSMLG